VTLAFSGVSQNEFAFDMYGTMDKEKNILFSPTCIKAAFAMAFEGANTKTQSEFEKVFDFKEDNSKFLAEIEYLKSVTEISNSVWILENYEILDSYIDNMKSNFNLEPYSAKFASDPKGSADRINAWIEKSTKGMIKKMLNPADVADFKMALVNAIYFKQSWKKTFDEKLTKKSEFKNFDRTTAEVDMMHSLHYYRAHEGQKEKVIELPYADNKTSMVIVLPKKMKGYEMTNEIYTGLNAQLIRQKVNLDLVKFTFETPTFELKGFLAQLGLIAAFEDYADFSGMRKEKDLKIGTALHKAKIIVNEEGTEAAAVTVIGVIATSSISQPPPPILKITVDKPFYYFIKDNKTGTVLFMGRMNSM
jgi:serine protease inhibitor